MTGTDARMSIARSSSLPCAPMASTRAYGGRAAVHAGGHAQCRAHRHTPDTCERVALGLCRREHAVKRRLFVRGAVQAVAEPLGRTGQRIIDCLRQHPQPGQQRAL